MFEILGDGWIGGQLLPDQWKLGNVRATRVRFAVPGSAEPMSLQTTFA